MEHKKFCPNCGGNIENFSGKFCPHCGHQIYENISENSSLMEKFSLSDEQKEQLKQKTSEITEIAKEKGKVYGKNLQTFLCYLWEQLKKFFAFLKVQYFKYKPIVIQKSKEFVVVVRNFYKTQKTKIFIIGGIILTLGVATFVGIYFVKPYLENTSKKDIVSTEKQGDMRQGENTSNNDSSGNSESSQKSDALKEELKEKYYEVIVEKSYFYTNPNDTEPRKAYVTQGDILEVNHEKSTGNMLFALYTNSAGKTTEGYLKKLEVKAVNFEKGEKIEEKNTEKMSNCLRTFNFAYGKTEDIIDGYRTFDFNLIGDCPHKQAQKIDYSGDAFRVATGQQAIFSNFMINSPGGVGGWCFINKPLYSKKFQKKNFEIDIKGGEEYCSNDGENDGEYSGDYLIIIDIFEKGEKIITLRLAGLTKGILKENYEDLLWTMENGFFEKGNKNIGDVKGEGIHAIKWNKDKLREWKFSGDGSEIFFENIRIKTGLNNYKDCDDDYFFGKRFFTYCQVTKISGDFMYWDYIIGRYTDDGDYNEETSHIISHKTNIKTEKTEIIKEFDTRECYDEGWEKISCRE